MLPSAPPLTHELAAQWLARATPRLYARALAALWGVAFLVAVITDNQVCTPSDPSVCGPSQSFAFWFVVCCATPVLLLWMPLLGCVAGIAFGLADVAMDDVSGAKVAFSVIGLLSAVLALRLRRDAAAQHDLVAPRAAAVPPPVGVVFPVRRLWWGPVVTGLLLVAAVVSFVLYRHEADVERAHLARGRVVQAPVVAVDGDDWTITVEVPSGTTTRRVDVDVIEVEPYPVGSTTPVVVDPTDPSWVRLVAEPADPTMWESFAYGALLLALLLLGRGWYVRRETSRVVAGPTAGFAVRVLPEGGKAQVLPADGPATAIARVPVEWQGADGEGEPEEAEGWEAADVDAFGRYWRGEEEQPEWDPLSPEPAVLIGGLHDGGVAMLLLEDGALVPRGALRPVTPAPKAVALLKRLVPRRFRGAADEKDELPELDELGTPVLLDESVPLPELPLLAGPPSTVRLRGLLMLVAAVVGGPVAVALLAESWYERGLAALIGSQVLHGALSRLVQQVRVSREELEIVGPGRRHRVPWDRLHGVRRFDDGLAVAWEPDFVADVGPFAPSDGEDTTQRAQHLGAVMMLLRERARAAGAPCRDVVESPGASWFAIPAYVLVLGATAWLVGWPG